MPAHIVLILINVCTFLYLRDKLKSKRGEADSDSSGPDKHGKILNDETEFSSVVSSSYDTRTNTSIHATRNSNELPITFIESGKTSEDTCESLLSEREGQQQHKPLAGSTCVRLRDVHDNVNENIQNDDKKGDARTSKVAWLPANPSTIHLRGPDYLTTRQKHPSPGSLYTLKEMDVFYAEDDEYITNIGRRFHLPQNEFKYYNDDRDRDRHWCAPDTLIISFALPTTTPKVHFGISKGSNRCTENKGLVVCGYYQIKPEIREALAILSNTSLSLYEKDRQIKKLFPKTSKENGSLSGSDNNQRRLVNGIRLWEKWCSICAKPGSTRTHTHAHSDPGGEMQKRLKFVPRGENITDLGVPSWICKYNGKPMLIKRPGETNFIFSHPHPHPDVGSNGKGRILEININLHPLPYMFKQAMSYLNDHYFSKMNMTFGFVIEGRSIDELPEVLIGDPMSLPFNDVTKIVKSSNLFGN